MDAASVTDPANYRLRASGRDGTFGDGNEVDLTANLSAVAFDETAQVATLRFSVPFADEYYRLTVDGTASVTDAAGNLLLGGADFVSETLQIVVEVPAVTINMQAGSDSGVSDSDELTHDTTPTFDVTVNKRGRIDVDYDGDGGSDAFLDVAGSITVDSAPASAVIGQAILVSWTTTNRGDEPTSSPWFDHVYLSANTVWDASDRLIRAEDVSRHLPPAGRTSYSIVDREITIPFDAATGPQYLLFVADGSENQAEFTDDEQRLAVGHRDPPDAAGPERPGRRALRRGRDGRFGGRAGEPRPGQGRHRRRRRCPAGPSHRAHRRAGYGRLGPDGPGYVDRHQ